MITLRRKRMNRRRLYPLNARGAIAKARIWVIFNNSDTRPAITGISLNRVYEAIAKIQILITIQAYGYIVLI